MKFESQKIVPVLLSPSNFGSTVDADSINMAGFHRATFIINFGTCGDVVVHSVNCGASEGTKTTAVPFRYAIGGAAIGTAVAASTASCDVLGDTGETTVLAPTASLTCSTKMVVVEVEASVIAKVSAGVAQPWLTLTVACASGIASAVAILEPRYAGNRSATCLK